MITVFLKGRGLIEIADGSLVRNLADNKAIAAIINDKLVDIGYSAELKDKDTVEIIERAANDMAVDIIRHSTAHILAMALKEIDPSVILGIGPTIENGFYYDIQSNKTYTIEDFANIESKMNDIIEMDLPFERVEMDSDLAADMFLSRGEILKVDLIRSLNERAVSLYKIGETFVDLCRGPHVPRTSCVPLDSFRLTSIAGAYWRGDSSGQCLQRIYGTAWTCPSDMNSYFEVLKEAALRDHRKLGPELNIFHVDEEAVGSVFWLKNGHVLFNNVKDFISKVIKKHGYFQVQTPQLLSKTLWETSGHWDKFRDNMFVVNSGEDRGMMAVKPMNCPGHILIYKNGPVKSYRDLPLRMAEFGLCHRNESSGSLHGLMRLRAFMQDDGHVFCSPDQIVSETKDIFSSIKEIYSAFGFHDISVKFSDRPEKRVGSDEIWDIAENALLSASTAAGLQYTVNRGEGAFYGPKLEFVLKDCLGRDWQCGTIQVDFVLPERFNIHYIDKDGKKQRPVMLHRALVGSLERFIGILIEHYSGKFPFWLAPLQIAVTNVSENSAEYAAKVCKLLDSHNFRCILDIENEKISYKIREYSTQKIPVIIILGQKEFEQNTVSIRKLGDSTNEAIPISGMVDYFSRMDSL